MTKIIYSSNNSGGHWWLEDEDWKALEEAGWTVEWKKDIPNPFTGKFEERHLGALATSAYKDFKSTDDAEEEFAKILDKIQVNLVVRAVDDRIIFIRIICESNSRCS